MHQTVSVSMIIKCLTQQTNWLNFCVSYTHFEHIIQINTEYTENKNNIK